MSRSIAILTLVFTCGGCIEEPECLQDRECGRGQICVGNSCAQPFTDGPLRVRVRASGGREGPGVLSSLVTDSSGTRPGGGSSGSSTGGGAIAVPHQRRIQVDFCSKGACRVEPGLRDDPAVGRSVLVRSPVELPDAGGSHAAVLSCVRELLGFTGAQISADPPSAGQPFRRVIVTTNAELLGRESTVKGLAPSSRCTPEESAIAFVFVSGTGPDSRVVCEEIARQVGFTAGLDTVTDCSDVMSGVERCRDRVFVDRENACGQLEERRCCWGGTKQNGHGRLLETLTR